jgi:hypothetical protein
MSQQLQITGGAKVRDLNDVIIGTSGVLSSLAFNVANGVPKLDSNAKILVSQLPNSVMEYQGTWNANTNTPTLTNGGAFNQGDVYLCNVAGTTNFGAGPISFIVGDSAIYSGSIWQRSGGATGSVTSVGLSTNGNSITIGSSPITTSGTITANFAGTNLQYINGAGNLTTFPTLISSIGLSMPSAFSVANSPLTANGTIAVTGAGYPSQYIRGDGTLADFPTSGGGGSSVSYYLNGGTSQGTIGGVTYYEMSKTADTGTGVDFLKTGDGLIVSFLTDANDPAQLNIPAGNWNYEIYASMSSNGGTPQLYAELYVYNGTTFTLISTSSNEILYDGVNLNLYTFAMTVPSTTLALTDRLAIKLYSTNSGGKTTTVHTQDSHLCQIITTFSTGITALNGLTAQVQYFATGTSGTDFAISSATATHTFNLPTASATNRGALSSADWTTFNSKVGGSGSDGRVAFWTGASTLSSDANLYYDYSTDRLGIGTNTPNASLGILNASSIGIQVRTSDSANQYQANIYYDSSFGMVYGYNRLGSGTASNLSLYNSLGGFISVPESSTNNIGFNTLNPQGLASATVYDFTSLNTNVEIRLHNSSTGYTSSDGSFIRVTSTALSINNAEASQDILINNGGFNAFRINSTNKVGIGDFSSTTPTEQLSVAGSIQQTGITSTMVKVDSLGKFVAAVGGTDYEYPLTFSSPLVRTTNTISIPAASTSVSGYLTSTDWNTFNSKGSGTVTSVSGTAPVVSSGGTTPTISMAAATTSVSGYLTSTDWNTFNGKFTLPSLTQGSILFSNGSTIAQNNSKLYWDNTNMRLGIGSQSVAQYVTYIQANTATNANAWVAIDNPNATGSTALRLILNGGTTSGFQYVQSTNMTQVYANAGDIQLINGSSLGLTIANTSGNGTFDAGVRVTNDIFIGDTTTGSGRFFITDSSNQGITLRRTGATGDRFKMFVGNGTTYTQDNAIILGTNTDIDFYTGATPVRRMTVSNSGNLLLGSPTSGWAGTTGIELNGDETVLAFRKSGANAGYVYHNGTNLYVSNELTGASAGSIIFNNNAGTRMTITSTGNVGIGTGSPQCKLQVSGSANFSAVLKVSDTGTESTGVIVLGDGGSTTQNVGIWRAAPNSMTTYGNSLNLGSYNDMVFAVGTAALGSQTERMRIAYTNGNILIGTTDNSANAKVLIKRGSADYPLAIQDGAVNLLLIGSDGSGYLKVGPWSYGSDRRMKENISYIQTGLNKIMALKPATFDYIDGSKNNIGWIAQDIQEVIPEAVSVTPLDTNGYLNLKSDFIVPYLVKAIQEQQIQIEELKALINK